MHIYLLVVKRYYSKIIIPHLGKLDLTKIKVYMMKKIIIVPKVQISGRLH